MNHWQLMMTDVASYDRLNKFIIAMTNVVMAQVIPVRLTEEDFQLYYNGCCNATFWPLFHSMPDRWVTVVFEDIPSKIPVKAFGIVSVEGL